MLYDPLHLEVQLPRQLLDNLLLKDPVLNGFSDSLGAMAPS